MSSLLKAFKEFYNEINGATLTGAIDVIVVEHADGSFVCSPFHVRFGKLGVLRSREKIVDIEVNGEPVNIHMKLGESGEAFFVQEWLENESDDLPANLATSPLPSEELTAKYSDGSGNENSSIELKLRRNSTALSQSSHNENEKVYENQASDYTKRRHTEKDMEHRDFNQTKLEYTTEQIRQELAAREAINTMDSTSESAVAIDSNVPQGDEQVLKMTNDATSTDVTEKADKCDENRTADVTSDSVKCDTKEHTTLGQNAEDEVASVKEPETKSKKKRRKKSMMKKKASSAAALVSGNSAASNRKGSGSSGGSASAPTSDPTDIDTDPNQPSSSATSASIDDLAKSEVVAAEILNESAATHETMDTARICDFHFFSDTEVAASPYGSRPSTPIQSDSEFEISQRDNLVKNEKNSDPMSSSTASWKWGEFPITPLKSEVDPSLNKDAKQAERNSALSTMLSFMKETMKMRKSSSEGVYLSDLVDADTLDPSVAALYFPPKSQSFQNIADADDHESGNGTSLPHSPSSMENGGSKSMEFDFDQDGKLYDKNVIALSLCGGLDKGGPSEEEFERCLIDYSEVCRNPSVFSSSLLVVRLCGKYYSWDAACPIVMTAIAYRKPLSNIAVAQLMSANKLKSTEETSNKFIETTIIETVSMSTAVGDTVDTENRRTSAGGYSWWNWRRSTDKAASKSPDQKKSSHSPNKIEQNKADDLEQFITSRDVEDSYTGDNKNDDSISSELADISKISYANEKYRKTLRLTSEQIESLNLKPGMNELEFSVTTAYQGTSRCKCYLFRWKHTDKVVISDIDGTITKSDVLGHILPMVGKDWAQLGVAELFTKIEKNGYKLLYLSARAIGQSRATRDYLRSIQQGDVKLPDGPLLLNPTSLISAFHREVIERKPEQFKIACLSDIKALFPENPFYAGYGNRINDVWAYRAVGIPIIRIFTINPKGELKHELNKTFQSSYRSMAYIVDQLFPPVNDREESVEFSNFNYWRDPIEELDSNNFEDLDASNHPNSALPRVCQTPATPVAEDDTNDIPENIKV